ncbi:extracellular solute-binding protein [Butyrivibrio sp. NC2002]|uniref:extracellular solute-binding protein n=1 Tax=Butyrivibrio sp. NC2002 TaxID=1410610 RepID=UPI000568556B|nr:extracellular solute-binding protein [Butyrivibrio sp. NC2002]
MRKKVLSTLMATVLTVATLAGCGGSSSPAPASDGADATAEASETTEAATEEASEATDTADSGTGKQTDGKNLPTLTTEPLEILLWDIATDDPGKSTQEAAVQRFMADYPNIKVTQVHQQNDNYKQQLVVAMSSGQCPDMYMHWGGGPMAEYYKSGFANDITDMYAKYDHPEFIDAAIAQSSYDGKLLAIPFGGLSGCDIYYNKTIFAEQGIEVPTTIDELEAACEKLKSAGYIPFALANASKWTGSMYYMYLVARHSGNAEFDAAYTQENGGSFNSPAFIYAAEKIQDWVKKGYFPDGVNSLTADDNQDRALMYDGSAAMMLHGSWQSSAMKNDNEEWYTENIGVFRFPEDTEAKEAGVPQNVEIGTAIGNGFSFNCFKEDGSVDQEKLDACYVLATQYYNDETYNDMQVSVGAIPSIKGYGAETVDDPNDKIVADVFFSASNVQLWYDQYLPASVTEVHKNCMTELFGLEKTPEEIGQEEDEAMQKAIAEQ